MHVCTLLVLQEEPLLLRVFCCRFGCLDRQGAVRPRSQPYRAVDRLPSCLCKASPEHHFVNQSCHRRMSHGAQKCRVGLTHAVLVKE
jgi:hypothetical protein